MTFVSPADLVAAVERGCRGMRAPLASTEPDHRPELALAPGSDPPGEPSTAVLEAAFRAHRLVVAQPAPYGVLVTGRAGGWAARFAPATGGGAVPFRADPSCGDALAGAFPDDGLLFLVCVDFGRMSVGRTPTAYPDLLVGAGALARALDRAAADQGLGSRIHTRGLRPVTSAVRQVRPGLRHVLTVTARPTDGSLT
ncbi:hypothetical protein ACWEQ7_08235 [Streptomyces sp. NPDC004069]|uniref:hypothetical protein n=1 Tax=Streptomyces sp. NPDC052043 TaxID=3365684 RepID=UPI0037CF81E4